jgi:hypothetical protein
MFVIEWRSLRLRLGFFIWAFIFFAGAAGLTMHVHYDPDDAERATDKPD